MTVAKKFRDYLGLKPGAAVDFSLGAPSEMVVRLAAIPEPRCGKGCFAHLRGTLDTGCDTHALIALLRGYDADARDPGLK